MGITGNPFIDSILETALTGRAAAALGPMPEPFATPPFVQQTPATRPRTVFPQIVPTQPQPPVTPVEIERMRQEAEIARQRAGQTPQVQEILKLLGDVPPFPEVPPTPAAPPINPAVIEQFKAMAGQAPAPYVPPAPVKQTLLQGLTQALQRGVTAGLTRDPGATLLALGQQDVELAERRRAEEIRKQERAEDRQDRFNQTQRQFELTGVQEATRRSERAQEIEIRRSEREFDKKFQETVRRLGLRDQGAIELLRDSLLTERDKERERAADERLNQQQRLRFEEQVADQIKFYRSQGVRSPSQARRLALNDFAGIAEQLGVKVPPLSGEDNTVLGKVQAQIDRLRQLASGGGGGGGRGGGSGSDKIQTWVELSSGDIVPADKVNFDRLPVGVTVKRMFSTVGIGGQELRSGGAGQLTLDEAQRQLGVMRNASKSAAEINAAIDSMIKDNPKLKGELDKLRIAPAPARNFNAPVFANPEGTAFGLGGTGEGTSISPEELRGRIQLDKMRAEVNYIRGEAARFERDANEAVGVVQKQLSERLAKDAKARLKNAEDRLREAEGRK